MKKAFYTIILILLFTASLFAQRHKAEIVPGEILLQQRPGHSLEQLPSDLNAQFPGLQASMIRELSAPMRIWHLRFNPTFDHQRILDAVNAHSSVTVAQSNHVIKQRATTPNDAGFAQQWQYINNGSNGGVVDADIDAELAWDFTTGGLTPFGDTIVACIIDDGISLNHPDFGTNRWYNYQEIPGNNIDDDGNGYVDDFNGWDADNNDDNVSGGGHGTPVAGIVGAKGNNNTGVSGVNWDVKLMIVEGGGNEAGAVAAYSYPLAMRKLWNATNGAKGAFVVVTNASWGVDYGQPSQAPLWCAMYDSLGKYGVLSCGATANINLDIDAQGDLPTACPSDYLISVTNMNRSDNKVNQAGYGITTIDLGAHGEDTYTTNGGLGYGGFGGTSGATPHVTGTVALLYSAQCSNLAALAISHPDSAARLMKQFILDGTDPNASIANNTVTGGRLNLHGAILELLSWNCSIGSCYQAFALAANQVSDTSATLAWNALSNADSFLVDFRAVGASSWISTPSGQQSLFLDTLRACTPYEFRVTALCDTATAALSPVFAFTTDGCCLAPTGFDVSSISPTSATITFDSVLAANSYTLQYALSPGGTWITLAGLSSPSVVLTGLDSCTTYDFRVQTVCDTGSTAFSPVETFSTNGCQGCEQTYCSLSGNDASQEWIAGVTMGLLSNTSGTDNGYGDYSGLSTVPLLPTYATESITLTPGFALFPYPEYFMVYIDYNQDGDFDDPTETAFDAGNSATAAITGSITIPGAASLGITRMRVVMRWNDPNSGCSAAFDYGEVEDYCVEIVQGFVGIQGPEASGIKAWPNPFQEKFTIEFPALGDQGIELYLIDAMGNEVRRLSLEGLASGTHQRSLQTDDLPAGIYFLRYVSGDEEKSLKLNLIK